MTSFAAGFTGTGKGVKYQWGDGAYCTNNWVQYKNHWFYFGDDQLMRTGWIQKDGTWYYAADTGELQGGIMKINGNVYYFDTSTCKMVTGNYSYNGGTHELQKTVPQMADHMFTMNGTATVSSNGEQIWSKINIQIKLTVSFRFSASH